MKVTVGFEGYSGGLREHGGSVKCWDLFSNPDGFGVGEFLRLAQHFNGAFLEPTPQGSLLELGKGLHGFVHAQASEEHEHGLTLSLSAKRR